MVDDLHSRTGLLLYRQLPEEYRYRDTRPGGGELGDLEAYLHGHGALMDLLRGTLEQLYADGFADPVDPGGPTATSRSIQPWLLPYLAELVGADLVSPDPAVRRQELAHSVGWYKAKGTMGAIDSVADVVARAETYIVEGWRRTLTTPRQTLPPFSVPAAEMGDGSPSGPTPMPLGCPDLRTCNRAVIDPAGDETLMALHLPQRDAQGLRAATRAVYWKPLSRTGAPCFPGGFDDVALHAPDLRHPVMVEDVGPNPWRTLVYVQPPAGFFEEGLLRLAAAAPDPLGIAGRPDPVIIGPAEAVAALQPANIPVPDRVEIDGDLVIPANRTVTLQDLLVLGTITVRPGATLILRRCAAARVNLPAAGAQPSLDASDSLIGEISGVNGFARLEYVTVLDRVRLFTLQASDCIFAGPVNPDICAAGRDTCIRYSRVPGPLAAMDCALAKAHNNTALEALFLPRVLPGAAGACEVRQPVFGEVGAGVLSHNAPQPIRAGAERGGEMGAYHHLAYAASLEAVSLKLSDFLPLGQELALVYDARLALAPPRAV